MLCIINLAESANTNTAVLTTMNDAAKALKKANADLDVDKVNISWLKVNQIMSTTILEDVAILNNNLAWCLLYVFYECVPTCTY